jgi:hypothetical protein
MAKHNNRSTSHPVTQWLLLVYQLLIDKNKTIIRFTFIKFNLKLKITKADQAVVSHGNDDRG